MKGRPGRRAKPHAFRATYPQEMLGVTFFFLTIEFRSVTVQAFKGKQGPCFERNQSVIYLGPFKERDLKCFAFSSHPTKPRFKRLTTRHLHHCADTYGHSRTLTDAYGRAGQVFLKRLAVYDSRLMFRGSYDGPYY